MNIDILKDIDNIIIKDNVFCCAELEQLILSEMDKKLENTLFAKQVIKPEFFYYLGNEFKNKIYMVPDQDYKIDFDFSRLVFRLNRYYITKLCLENHPDENLVYSIVILHEKQLLKPDQLKADAEWLKQYYNINLGEI